MINIRHFLLCGTVFIVFSAGVSQITFQKHVLESSFYEAKQTNDGGFVATGWRGKNICLIKTNASGDILWSKTFGESNDAIALSMDLTFDGGFIIAGVIYDTFQQGGSIYLIKTDSQGDTVWTRKLGGKGNEQARCVHQTIDGGYIISGESDSFSTGDADMYIIKIDSKGTVEWSRTIGGIKDDICYSILQTQDSGFVAVGTINAYSPNSDIVIIKMNSIGDTLWTKTYGGSSQDIGFEIISTFNHGFAITGSTGSFGSSDRAFLFKTDSLGNSKLFKMYGGINSSSYSYSFCQTADSGYVLAGLTNGFGAQLRVAPLVIKLNGNGDTLWSAIYNETSSSLIFSITQTFDGGYITCGEQELNLMKLNSLGKSGCLEKYVHPFISTLVFPSLINNSLTVGIPNATTLGTITSVGSGIGIENICISTNVKENVSDHNAIQILPNPSQDYFTIQAEYLLKNMRLEIWNSIGEQVYTEVFNETQKTINSSQFSSGFYIVNVLTDRKCYNKKIIIK
jgi:hypothetical protein